ncbi:16S rRNA (uracil(1498)-N(3))-methyltransferase [Parvularcula sp. ZS-1/3]|uniref:Ribosomal RNA small subunit methyltransferase E n=1 Tax=Parvularcula mediterranea TaxID=2732508 RepID=A0A7Y3RJ11_9PROT|nr:16S rRNA (uracil(1498)-N(3))-methyltransferase [Parvularcula mediterranea]
MHTEARLGRGSYSFDKEQARYLGSVLRLKAGDEVRLFNARDGEWVYRVASMEKRAGEAEPVERRREGEEPSGPVLLFAPIKRTQTELLAQKATELGVRKLVPVVTARTNRDQLRIDRLELIATEAAEQCERLTIPQIEQPRALADVLEGVGSFLFCDEAGDQQGEPWGGDEGRAPLGASLIPDVTEVPGAILIGPEGGFTPEERESLRADERAVAISLGPRILRAETAAIVALTLWQARFGDLA